MGVERIVIFGLPGAGKSRFADQLCQQMGLPLFHLDKYYFEAGWAKRNYEEYLENERWMVDQAKWIIDGNCMKSIELRFARAQRVYYFRVNRFVCLWRMIRRMVKPDRHIDDMSEGCTKTVTWKLVSYMWQFHKRFGKEIDDLRKKYREVEFIIVR